MFRKFWARPLDKNLIRQCFAARQPPPDGLGLVWLFILNLFGSTDVLWFDDGDVLCCLHFP